MFTEKEARDLGAWYRENRRDLPWRDTGDPEDVWISEIMLQQTRVEAVKGYFTRFRAALPDARAIAACPDDALMKLWEGLGYYSRARNLKKCAEELVARYDGKLPADHDALRALPGIGDYTAGAIASIAFGIPVPAVDGNVLRVWARVNGYADDVALPATKKRFTAEIASLLDRLFPVTEAVPAENAFAGTAFSGSAPAGKTSAAPGEPTLTPSVFTQSLMELGAVVCVPNGAPSCPACPIRESCEAFLGGTTGSIPFRSPKKARRIEERTILVIRDGSRFLFRKRPGTGLLAGLWEFPGVPGHLDEDAALKAAVALGFEPLRIRVLPDGKHIFTHIEWRMRAYEIRVASFREYDEEFRGGTAGVPEHEAGLRSNTAGVPEHEAGLRTGDTDSEETSGTYRLITRDGLRSFAVPSAFRTWTDWYALKE